MLKKAASFVLAGHRRLTKTLGAHQLAPVRRHLRHRRFTDSPARTNVALIILRAVRLIILRVADLAAAALDGLFDHLRGLVGYPRLFFVA